jgi:hypothetical protein
MENLNDIDMHFLVWTIVIDITCMVPRRDADGIAQKLLNSTDFLI